MEPKYKTGLERFYEKYPDYPRQEKEEEYLGVGAICDPHLFDRDSTKYKEQKI